MRISNQKGFTIIEVILFLALSSLFLTIAFLGIRGKTANVQFTDSMRSLQSFLVSEQNKLLNGVNSTVTAPIGVAECDGATTGTSNKCIIVGRVVSFGKDLDQSLVSVDVLYGTKPTAQDLSSKDDYELIEDTVPREDVAGASNYEINWGTTFNSLLSFDTSSGGSNERYDRIGWIRSPGSTRIIPIAFNGSVPDLDGLYYYKTAPESRMGDDVEVKLCFTGDDTNKFASINFGNDEGAAAIELVFDDGACK